MPQKYKVFVEQKVIYFTDKVINGILESNFFIPIDFADLDSNIINEQQFVSENPEDQMNIFFSNFKNIEAAGGVVVREDKLLFIKRNGYWDIPKGKMEENEMPEDTAVREIREECGLNGEFTIRKKLIDTFHTYEFKNKSVLKNTHWFLIDFDGNKFTNPQLEEGISEVIWIKSKDLEKIKANTYSSIHEVLFQLKRFNLD